ncbi:zinc finger protein 391-like [Anopheles funestus]|uniref:zinc finger protein 391-like n=1 Tax=Anopheles funestus TaxID=62324 RepID=UPI000859B3D0|nr:zinc finger protein 391-like [Anopheles funestus]
MQCRICLKQCDDNDNEKSATLFHSFINGVHIGEFINDLFDLQMAEDDSLPQTVCEQCHLELQIVSIFRDRLLMSEKTLRTSIQYGEAVTYEEGLVEESIASCTATTSTLDPAEQDSMTTASRCSNCKKMIYETEPTYLVQQSCPSSGITNKVLCQECYQQIPTGQKETEGGVQKASIQAKLDISPLTIDLQPSDPPNIGSKPYRFCCVTHCSEQFTDEAALIKHTQAIHAIKINKNRENQEPGRPFKCNICFRAFASSKNLRVHQLVRSNVHYRNFTCNTCPFRAGSLAALTIHKRSHTGERPFECDSCEKRFYSEALLKSHQVCHRGERPFECSYCSKKFARKRNMMEHFWLCQSDEKPYQCDDCSARFKTMQHLRLHRRLHTGEKPYTCSLCAKNFHYINDRKRHELSHAGTKPYSCKTCDASYTRKYALSMHERTHTGEQPFGCTDCGKRFSQSSLLKRHLARHRRGENSVLSKQQNSSAGRKSRLKKVVTNSN